MVEVPGRDDLHARGAKDKGDPDPPPLSAMKSGSSEGPPGAHSAIDKAPPDPPLVGPTDETDDARGTVDQAPPDPPVFKIVVGAAVAAFLAGAHAMEAYLSDCLNAFAVGLTAAEIAAAVLLIQWLIDTVHARGTVDKGDPDPPPLSALPKTIAAALLALAAVIGIVLALMGDCLAGIHLALGVSDGLLAVWILTWTSQGSLNNSN